MAGISDTPIRRDTAAGVLAVAASLALPLTMFSALLYLAGIWSPWMDTFTTVAGSERADTLNSGVVSGSAVSFTGLLSLVHHQPKESHLVFGWFGWLDVLAMGWDLVPLCAIVLSLALWQSRGASRALRGVYAVWLLFATAVTGVGIYGAVAVLAGDRCEGDCASAVFIDHQRITWGVWPTLCALLLAWVALVALARRRTDSSADRRTASPRISLRSVLVAAGVYTLGIGLWALGLLLVPWVTAGCSGIPLSITHFVRGSCSGLDGYDVLSAGMVNGPEGAPGAAIWNLGLDPYRIIVLLVFAGVVLAVLLWRPGRLGQTRATRYTLPVATVAWVLLVALAFLVGWQGTTYRLGHQGAVVLGGASQVVGPGLWICAVGILFACAGSLARWLAPRMPRAHARRHNHARTLPSGPRCDAVATSPASNDDHAR